MNKKTPFIYVSPESPGLHFSPNNSSKLFSAFSLCFSVFDSLFIILQFIEKVFLGFLHEICGQNFASFKRTVCIAQERLSSLASANFFFSFLLILKRLKGWFFAAAARRQIDFDGKCNIWWMKIGSAGGFIEALHTWHNLEIYKKLTLEGSFLFGGR